MALRQAKVVDSKGEAVDLSASSAPIEDDAAAAAEAAAVAAAEVARTRTGPTPTPPSEPPDAVVPLRRGYCKPVGPTFS